MRFVARVIVFLCLLVIRQAYSQTLNQPDRSQLLSSPSFVDLPDNPHPATLDGAKPIAADLTMPLSVAVSVGAAPGPTAPREAWIAATHKSFERSSYISVGITSLIAEAANAHPALGKGASGLWAYSWRGFLDRTDGNYWVIFALPVVFHEDEQFRVMQHGRKFYRLIYGCGRVLITRDDRGRKTVNAAELLGRGASEAISLTYYPRSDRSAQAFAGKYGYALLRDAATNVFREFWSDLKTHVLHHRL